MKLLLTCFKCHQETALLTYEENRMYKVSCPCGCEYTFEHSSMACAESYHLREVELQGEIDRNKDLTVKLAALQAKNAELKQRLAKINDFEQSQCAKLLAKLSRVETERDAAVEDIYFVGGCPICKKNMGRNENTGLPMCAEHREYPYGKCFVWRGVRGEE